MNRGIMRPEEVCVNNEIHGAKPGTRALITTRRRLRVSLPALLIAAIILPLVTGSGTGPNNTGPKKQWPKSVQKAFKTIGTKECYNHVAVLASEEFEGRAAGERGGRLASEYVAMQFLMNGIAPGGPGGSYFQRFPILLAKARAGELAESNYLRLLKPGSKGDSFDLFEDFTPAEVSGESVTGGGLAYLSSEGAAEDSLPAELAGKIVILSEETFRAERAREPAKLQKNDSARSQAPPEKAGDPEKKPPEPELARPLARFVDAGVRGLLVVTTDRKQPDFEEESWPLGEGVSSAELPVLHLGYKADRKSVV